MIHDHLPRAWYSGCRQAQERGSTGRYPRAVRSVRRGSRSDHPKLAHKCMRITGSMGRLGSCLPMGVVRLLRKAVRGLGDGRWDGSEPGPKRRDNSTRKTLVSVLWSGGSNAPGSTSVTSSRRASPARGRMTDEALRNPAEAAELYLDGVDDPQHGTTSTAR